jgi:hypothetical protein
MVRATLCEQKRALPRFPNRLVWRNVSEHTHRLGAQHIRLSFGLLLSFFVIVVHVFPDDG